MNERIKVLVVEPNKLPRVEMIDNNLESKQKLVGGYIEYVYRDYYPNVIFICNEEGKILGLPFNRDIGGDIIAGTFVILGDDPEKGEEISLTDSQVEKYQQLFGEKSIEDTNYKLAQIYLENNLEM